MKGKTICKTLGLVLLALLILVVLYVVYVFASYHRIGNQSLSVMHCSSRDAVPMEDAVETGAVYRVSSANAGFGAYSADYSFFMDGGRESRARSRQAVDENMRGIVAFVKGLSPDFALFQEVDTDGTRSWHIDETAYLSDAMTGCEFDEVFAQNYDSPYLFYPHIHPHGANQSGAASWNQHAQILIHPHKLSGHFPVGTFNQLYRILWKFGAYKALSDLCHNGLVGFQGIASAF